MNISGWFILIDVTDAGQSGESTRWQVKRKKSSTTWLIYCIIILL